MNTFPIHYTSTGAPQGSGAPFHGSGYGHDHPGLLQNVNANPLVQQSSLVQRQDNFPVIQPSVPAIFPAPGGASTAPLSEDS